MDSYFFDEWSFSLEIIFEYWYINPIRKTLREELSNRSMDR